MDGDITGNKRQAVGNFKALLAECSVRSFPGDAQGCFMNQLQCHSGIDFRGLLPVQLRRRSPGAEAQVLRDKHPDAGEVTGDLVTKELANLSFNTDWFTGHHTAGVLGSLGFDFRGS